MYILSFSMHNIYFTEVITLYILSLVNLNTIIPNSALGYGNKGWTLWLTELTFYSGMCVNYAICSQVFFSGSIWPGLWAHGLIHCAFGPTNQQKMKFVSHERESPCEVCNLGKFFHFTFCTKEYLIIIDIKISKRKRHPVRLITSKWISW